MLKSILLSSLVLNLGLLLGRLSGFLRESFLAANFGVGVEADIAVLMLSLPDLLVNILVGGALAAALIPEFNRRADLQQPLLGQALLVMSVLFGVLSLLLNVFVGPFMSVFAPGFGALASNLAIGPMGVVLWLIPLTVLAGVYTAFLQAQDHFAVPALGTLMINLVIVLGLVGIGFWSPAEPLTMLALVVLLGGVLRLLAFAVTGWRVSGWPVFAMQPWLISRDLLKKFLQVASAGSLLLCFPVVIRAFASYSGEGAVAQVSYALKLVELPLALTVTFLGVVLFPRLSRAYESGSEQFGVLVLWGLRITLLLALVAVAAMLPIAGALVDMVYGYGKMESASLDVISGYFAIAVFYIPFMGLATFITACLNAQRDMFTPLWVNGLGFVGLMVAMLLLPKGQVVWQLMALVSAYGLIGVLGLVVLLVKMPDLVGRLFALPSILLAVVLVGIVSVAASVIADVVEWSIVQIALSAMVAGLACVVAGLFVPGVLNRVPGLGRFRRSPE